MTRSYQEELLVILWRHSSFYANGSVRRNVHFQAGIPARAVLWRIWCSRVLARFMRPGDEGSKTDQFRPSPGEGAARAIRRPKRWGTIESSATRPCPTQPGVDIDPVRGDHSSVERAGR